MRKQLTILLVIMVLAFTACNTTPKGDNATTSDTQTVAETGGIAYKTDSMSSVHFVGNGVGKNHPGKFKITDGTINVADNKVTSGSFTIDITSLSLDEPGEMIQTKLKGHLLAPDFFDASKYATAKFEITKVLDYTNNDTDKSVVEGANALISGNLTLKDQTKNVTFPAAVSIIDNIVTAKANFNIDRTEFGMNYNSDKSLKDKFISPEVNISLEITASN